MEDAISTAQPPAGAPWSPGGKPPWLRVVAPGSPDFLRTRALLRERGLRTVCEEAACPNRGECWEKGHATVMILGRSCTRACAFCNVETGRPEAVDPGEPERVAEAVAALGLSHVVVTSVDRDDLPDGGAAHFVRVIGAIRSGSDATVEVLTPDFRGRPGAVETVAGARPDVFNHNLETVPRLYATARRGARYEGSLRLLSRVKEVARETFTKSGLMLGLGEARDEVVEVLRDLRRAGVDFVTIGQYLRPGPENLPVARYAPPEEFLEYARVGREMGFGLVAASPLTRSSHHAAEDFARLRAARAAEGVWRT